MKSATILNALYIFTATVAAVSCGNCNTQHVSVKLPFGTIIGRAGLTSETFNGIPYARPPVGPLRLKPPQALDVKGIFNATGQAKACPQLLVSAKNRQVLADLDEKLLEFPFVQPVESSEDCLTVSVQRPSGTKAGERLPVLFWIYGGGFQSGSTNTYDPTSLLAAASAEGLPFIYVGVNYRVGAYGFLPGAEVLKDASTNLGWLDQRMALQWVADNIAYFGGDPDKVTLWGESAGSISVLGQMMLYGGDAMYKGKPLFRAGIMNSGTILPANPVNSTRAQAVYDQVVNVAGCNSTGDTLPCLRRADYDKFHRAATSFESFLSYTGSSIPFLPRPDGKVLPDSPEVLISSGRYYAVPVIVGDQEDEGTLFSIFQNGMVSTDDKLVEYLSSVYFPDANQSQLAELVNAYPSKEAGSPFRTGNCSNLYPNYKRLAALVGDITFTLSRRIFLEMATKSSPTVPIWSYLSSYLHKHNVLGTYHASDLFQVFDGTPPSYATTSNRRYYLNFLYNLDPNKGGGGYSTWPQWKDNRTLMWFKTQFENGYLNDNFRMNAQTVISRLGAALRA
ncbi:cholinesterase [Pochonia chlamydosporia 170]|uniref:Carboxylic ester hydrolase n=1 Tax=Pochonia chlamydosporia 170 TaxID=1380566 RepID=A0A179G247_METCM|nr:cholinesterase [Pochonia chlamydosporia 170]OAQ71431.1 cholinesterase [Pochonia chlamydosporia 170]